MHPFARAAADSAAARLLLSGPEPPRVLVALSGGPDSCALLLALCEAADAGVFPRPVGAAHFHHGLRGEDADGDAAFSAALCARVGLPCQIGLGAVSTAGGLAPNAAARRDRYAFLAEAARDAGADVIATAHTADDQAETVLLRVLRGASVDGLAAMPPVRELAPDLRLARPLLALRRAGVEAYCRDRGVTPRQDPSNAKERYARARLRRRMPELARDFNPRLADALTRLSAHAAADADLLAALADDLWRRAAVRCWPGLSVRLDAAVVASAHPALRRRVLLRAVLAAYGESDGDDGREEGATYAFVARLEEAVRSGAGAHDLPGGVRARVANGALELDRVTARETAAPFRAALPVPGAVHVPEARAALTAEEVLTAEVGARTVAAAAVLPPRALDAYADRDAALSGGDGCGTMATVLTVRSPRAGDRIAPLGMGGKTRLVRDVMADAGWEDALRPAALLVTRASDDRVLWVVGLAQAEEARVSEATRAVLRLSVRFDC